MAIIKVQQAAASTNQILAPFTTVNNGGARPLKGIAASEFGLLQNGTAVYVESVRDYYKWVPASTEADDTGTPSSLNRFCNPTVNGVSAGRFERLFICSPDWLLQDFVIDTALGHNENEGTALAPLYDDRELFQRWSMRGTARIETVRQVSYLQAPDPTSITVYDVTISDGASLSFFGNPDVLKPAITITAVTTQNRATDTRWAMTGATLGAADVGKLAVIVDSVTPAKIGAYAGIVENLGANTVVVLPFRVAQPGGFPGSALVTLVAGDVISIIDPTLLNVGEIKVAAVNRTFASGPSPLADALLFDGITLDGNAPNFGSGHLSIFDIYTQYYRCILQNITVRTTNNDFLSGHTMHGGLLQGFEVDFIGDGFLIYSVGFLNTFIDTFQSCFISMLDDCYFQNSRLNVVNGYVASLGTAYFNASPIAGAIGTVTVYTNTVYSANNPSITDWGTANDGYAYGLYSGGQITYRVTPTVNATLGPGRQVNVGNTPRTYAQIPYVEGANLAAMVLMAP